MCIRDSDDAIVFKIESHNHPSFIEPYQGAATGVGGIMRDVFTMGARPIANLNSIHFGSPQHKKTKNLLRGGVKGIGGYGNCIGVPTIGGQTSFDDSYNGNILGMMPHPERMIDPFLSGEDGSLFFKNLIGSL